MASPIISFPNPTRFDIVASVLEGDRRPKILWSSVDKIFMLNIDRLELQDLIQGATLPVTVEIRASKGCLLMGRKTKIKTLDIPLPADPRIASLRKQRLGANKTISRTALV